MNKIITIAFGMMLIAGVVAGAGIFTPMPIIVKVLTDTNQAVYCEITNLNTDEKVTGYTNAQGEFMVDWANTDYKYTKGNEFLVKCINKEVRVKYTGEPPTELVNAKTGEDVDIIRFDFTSGTTATTTTAPTTTTTSTTTTTTIRECPACVCPECPECVCPECEKCPATLEFIITMILAFFGIGLGAGTTGYKFVVRRRRGGKLEMQVTQHKHVGIDRYHSIYTLHNDPKIRHPRGCKNPIYKDGQYQRCGDE